MWPPRSQFSTPSQNAIADPPFSTPTQNANPPFSTPTQNANPPIGMGVSVSGNANHPIGMGVSVSGDANTPMGTRPYSSDNANEYYGNNTEPDGGWDFDPQKADIDDYHKANTFDDDDGVFDNTSQSDPSLVPYCKHRRRQRRLEENNSKNAIVEVTLKRGDHGSHAIKLYGMIMARSSASDNETILFHKTDDGALSVTPSKNIPLNNPIMRVPKDNSFRVSVHLKSSNGDIGPDVEIGHGIVEFVAPLFGSPQKTITGAQGDIEVTVTFT